MERVSQLLLTYLFNACWQVALIAAVATACGWLLRETPARCRHLLWMAALALSFFLPVLTALHFSDDDSPNNQLPQQTTLQRVIVDTSREPLDLTIPVKKTRSLIPVTSNLAAELIAVYLLFLCYRGVRLLRAWMLTRSIARGASTSDLPEHIRAIADRCQTALGVTRVGFSCSAAVSMPITLGSLNPLIVLPEPLLLEGDRDVLTSAIGHELVHVARRDYLLNLLCELIYVPLSFHPAAALVRRRIREARELSCDELVANRLLEASVYARSLVRLAGSAMGLGRQTTVTVGIGDADILEERVMAILKGTRINLVRRNLLLVAASLLLTVPCAAAVPFALRIDINRLNSSEASQQQQATQQAGDRAQVEVMTPALGADTEAGTVVAWLKKPGESVERGEIIAKLKTSKGIIGVPASTGGVIDRLLVAVGDKAQTGSVLAVVRSKEQSVGWSLSVTPQDLERQLLLQELEARLQDEQSREAEQKAKQRAERESAEKERPMTTTKGNLTLTNIERESRERQEAEEREMRERALIELKLNLERARAKQEEMDPEIAARRRAELEEMVRKQAELARQANISMQQAIQIATTQYPGTVLESRLAGERNQTCYIITILSDNGSETTTTRLVMSANDGSILKSIKEPR